jgi:hypothetical protein
MSPVSPVIPETNLEEVTYAKDQPEYQPLPSLRAPDGTILTRWKLTEEEKQQVLSQGYVYLLVMTFNQPLQPLLLTTELPDGFVSPDTETDTVN